MPHKPRTAMALTAIIGQTDARQVACLLYTALEGTPGIKPGIIGPDCPALSCVEALSAHLSKLAARGTTHAILVLDRPALARRLCTDLRISVAAPVGQAAGWQESALALAHTDIAILDLDEAGQPDFPAALPPHTFTYSENKAFADLTARNLRSFPGHTEFEAVATGQIRRIHLPVCGGFAVYHALCALSCGLCLGLELGQMARLLRVARGPAGCMEVLSIPAAYTVLLDRAGDLHSLERALTVARSFTARRLVCLLDCCGNDRPMEELAAQLADCVLPFGGERCPRQQAIIRGLDRAHPGDVLVLTGADGGAQERAFIRACAHNRALRQRQRT
ncbi:MAG: hypothetical protein E7450_05415 [Ruminococcaceae bacterium]|nr:hypothetical protein [Oscillospiraceae bacterium]